MTTTITLEFSAEPGLGALEHELKHIHGLKVFLVEPRDTTAPTLLSISIHLHGEQAALAIEQIAQDLYAFLHSSAHEASQQPVTLVTIEGESVEIASFSVDEIVRIITEAHLGQTA